MSDIQKQQATPYDPQREARREAAKRIDKVNDWLYLGGAVPPDQYERLALAGITHVIDLREGHEQEPDLERLGTLQIARYNAPIPNFTAPSTDQLDAIAGWLDSSVPSCTAYVHCQGGFGRAATIAAGLLVLRGASLEEAIGVLRKARPEIRINDSQLEWLRSVEQRRRNSNQR